LKKTFSETFPSGTVKTSVTSITLVNNTQKVQDVSVPSDTVWVIQCIRAVNIDDVQRTVVIDLWNEAAKTSKIARLQSGAVAAVTDLVYPSITAGGTIIGVPTAVLVLGPGMTISVTWAAGGVSTGATDSDGLVILYRELTLT